MNSFVECSIAMQNFLMILLEICLILELILFLLRITCFSGKKKVITAITVFAVSFVLMVSLMNEHRYSIGESAYQPMLQDYLGFLIKFLALFLGFLSGFFLRILFILLHLQ